jgi:ABC-type nitrate/sulfonate/bicarbonate transport system permease component
VIARVAGRGRDVAIALAVPVAAVAIWWVASAGSTSPFYPSLQAILDSFRQTWLFAHFGSDIVPSLERMLAGYAIAVVVGVGLGVLLGRLRTVDRAVQPLVQFGRATPATALVPVGITLLGIGDAPKIYLIAFVSLFPILLNTIDGVRAIEPGLLDVARSFRLTRWQRVFALQLPSAAPQIFAGMRIALGIAFIMMIVTEMVAATSGIGYITLNAQQSFQSAQMWAGMILLALLGAGINLVFVAIERRVLRWHHGATGRS